MGSRGTVHAALAVAVAGAGALSTPAPAAAQDIVVPSRPSTGFGLARVEDFSPDAGAAGTRVSIRGRNFRRDMRVVVGGVSARVVGFAPDRIDFLIPARGDGGEMFILQTRPTVRIYVGELIILGADLEVGDFDPDEGPPGTEVTIRGEGFGEGDDVFLGQVPVFVRDVRRNRLVVEIPPGARSDTFTVVSARSGARATTRAVFEVEAPAPEIADFAPKKGPPGTIVRITGRGFGPNVEARYGFSNLSMRIVDRRPGQLEVEIPPTARDPGRIILRSRRGRVETDRDFNLIRPAELGSFAPRAGGPGTRVAILGGPFYREDAVLLNGRPVRVVDLFQARLIVEIPPGASSGPFTLVRDGQPGPTTRDTFEVFEPPAISDFQPRSGPPGTRVRITGRELGRSRASYGNLPVRIVGRGDDELVVEIPADATGSYPVTLDTGRGVIDTPAAFRLEREITVIDDIVPRRGPAGTIVEVRGRYLDGTTATYAGRPIKIVERSPNRLRVQIPAEAFGSYPIILNTRYGTVASPVPFTLERPVARVEDMRPRTGRPGTTVHITGESFFQPQVSYDGRPVPILEESPFALVVRIPEEARRDAPFVIRTENNTVETPPFDLITEQARIDDFSPRSGPPGTRVYITGADLFSVRATYGGGRIEIVNASPGAVEVIIPRDARDSQPIVLETSSGSVQTRTPFRIESVFTVTGFTPRGGPEETVVRVFGSGFTGKERAHYGRIEMTILGWAPGWLDVVIPRDVTSDNPIVVTSPDGKELPSPYPFRLRR